MVDFPTRKDSILDIFVTNRPSLVNKCTPIPGLSDHDIVLIDANIVPSRQKPARRLIYLWNKANLIEMEQDIAAFSRSFTTEHSETTPINTLWDIFKKKCMEVLQKHVPSKYTSTRYSQSWCNRTIRRLSRRKRRAYRKGKRTNKDKDWARFKSLQQTNRKECKRAHDDYVNTMVSDGGNRKKLYSFVKNKKCDSSGVASLKKDGLTVGDARGKAEVLNSQFSSVFTKEDDAPLPDLGISSTPDAPNIQVGRNGVMKLLQGLKPHKATGPDEISSRFLKEMASPITPALTLIFQASLEQGQIPDEWKTANVAPIFKKGDKSKPSNYRPVSLTSICCKVIEHILHSHIMKFFEQHHILSDSQHGFRKNRSCETQLILTINDLANGLDNSQQIDGILLDFSKAFDKVPHRRLAAKLHHYGVRGKTLSWIQSFLAGRTQQVTLEGQASSTSPVTSGVPQGTVLGPLLFLVYINDLPSRVKATPRLFADDCFLYRIINSQEAAQSLQDDLDALQQWEKDWLMSFNPDKCEVIRITKKRKPIDANYTIHGKELGHTKNAKYLGVLISDNLSWNAHVDTVTKKANNTTAFLRRNLSSCPQHIKETCYKTFVRPQLEYAATVWDPHTDINIAKLGGVQRRAARFVTNDYNYTSSVTAMMRALEWESLQQRRQEAKAVMMYRIVNSLVDIPPQHHLHQQGTAVTRGHQSRFMVPYSRTDTHRTAFFPSAIRLWNQLPESLVNASSLDVFKTGIAAALST